MATVLERVQQVVAEKLSVETDKVVPGASFTNLDISDIIRSGDIGLQSHLDNKSFVHTFISSCFLAFKVDILWLIIFWVLVL